MNDEHAVHELLVESLNDEATLKSYKEPLDTYRPSLLPRLLGGILVWCGNVIYGKKPSYLKFRAVEVIARVPYHSWASAAFTLLTLFYSDEKRALRLSTVARFARFASDNETMHVVVISRSRAQRTSRRYHSSYAHSSVFRILLFLDVIHSLSP